MATPASQVFHPSGEHTSARNNLARIGLTTSNREKLIASIHRGLPVSVIDKLARELDVPQKRLLQVIALPSATLNRRRARKQRLTPQESDRIYRVANVFQTALQLFEGDRNAARRWFQEPATALRGKSPFEHLDTEAGAGEVLDLIGRLEHGVIS